MPLSGRPPATTSGWSTTTRGLQGAVGDDGRLPRQTGSSASTPGRTPTHIFKYDPTGPPLRRDAARVLLRRGRVSRRASHVRHPDWMTPEVLAAAEEAGGQEIGPATRAALQRPQRPRHTRARSSSTSPRGLSREGAIGWPKEGRREHRHRFAGHRPQRRRWSSPATWSAPSTRSSTPRTSSTWTSSTSRARYMFFGLPLSLPGGHGLAPIRAVAWLREGYADLVACASVEHEVEAAAVVERFLAARGVEAEMRELAPGGPTSTSCADRRPRQQRGSRCRSPRRRAGQPGRIRRTDPFTPVRPRQAAAWARDVR